MTTLSPEQRLEAFPKMLDELIIIHRIINDINRVRLWKLIGVNTMIELDRSIDSALREALGIDEEANLLDCIEEVTQLINNKKAEV